MDVFQIEGPVRLSGHVDVNGSKNASLPIMAATLLAPGRSTLLGVPDLADIRVFNELIDQLGSKVERQADGLLTHRCHEDRQSRRALRHRPQDAGERLRPGAAAGAVRPGRGLHARRLRDRRPAHRPAPAGPAPARGPDSPRERRRHRRGAQRLKGASIFLGGPFGSTVLGTANVMMAATLAEGRTIIESAACEPEVVDLANCLNAMGARDHRASARRD